MLLNLERAHAIIEHHAVDALIATAPENVTYATDYDTTTHYVQRGFQSAAILSATATPVLVAPVFDYTYQKERPSWVQDVRFYGHHNLTTSADTELRTAGMRRVDHEIDSVLRNAGGLGSFMESFVSAIREVVGPRQRIAIDHQGMPASVMDDVRLAFPDVTFVDGFALWREIRMVKTAAEIDRIRGAIAANEAGFRAGFAAATPGSTEHEVYAAYRQAVDAAGAVPSYWDSGVGPRSYAFRPQSDRPLEEGDLVRIDASCIHRRYWSDLGRTGVIGRPHDKTSTYYGALLAGTLATMEACAPGVRPSELHRIAVEEVQKGGIPHYRRGHIGHSIGLEFYESPMLTGTGAGDNLTPHVADPALEPGMVLNIETPYYEIGFGGLQVEETVLITDDGYECLSSLPRGLFVAGSELVATH
jgi:Xaa-Pro dipeptidase